MSNYYDFHIFAINLIKMKKKITTIYSGINSQVADLLVNRLIPGKEVEIVGPIVFLDHVYPFKLKDKTSSIPNGEFAHPHRGIATFSYVFEGNLSHYDSRNNHGIISAGGVQWMKAGNGILHDEQPFSTSENDKTFHSLQFWINLPSTIKAEQPEYMAVRSEQVPEINLPGSAGILRLLLGEFGSTTAPIKTFCKEFIYHFRLNAKSQFSFSARHGLEYGAFVPAAEVLVNDTVLSKSKIAIFDLIDQEINLENPNILPTDVLIFGGLHYEETIASQGPFVMNSREEIAAAYRDFFEGKYGEINYTKV